LEQVDTHPKSEMNVILMKPDDDMVKNANELILGCKVESYEAIFEAGVLHYMDEPSVADVAAPAE
jgi:hypothetical protein